MARVTISVSSYAVAETDSSESVEGLESSSGVSASSAAHAAVGMGATVEIYDISLPRLRYLDEIFGGRLQTKMSTPMDIAASVQHSDLVIGSVLIPGSRAPKLVTDEMVAGMRRGSVLVDIAIDQGGCFEGSRPKIGRASCRERV